jgi:hypothetical protein
VGPAPPKHAAAAAAALIQQHLKQWQQQLRRLGQRLLLLQQLLVLGELLRLALDVPPEALTGAAPAASTLPLLPISGRLCLQQQCCFLLLLLLLVGLLLVWLRGPWQQPVAAAAQNTGGTQMHGCQR